MIFGMPDWLFFIIIFGLFYMFIYRNLPDDLQDSIREFVINYGVYIAILILVLYFRSNSLPIYETPDKWPADMKRADFFGMLGIFLYFAFNVLIYEWRYKTYHFVADDIHGSYHTFYEVGCLPDEFLEKDAEGNLIPDPWVIVPLGGAGPSEESFVPPWPFPKKIAVFPRSTAQFLTNQMFSIAQLVKTDAYKLPEEVFDYIEKNPLLKRRIDDVHFGIFSAELKATDPIIKNAEIQFKKENDQVNRYAKMMDFDLNAMKKFATGSKAITDKLSGRDWRQRQNRQSGDEQE